MVYSTKSVVSLGARVGISDPAKQRRYMRFTFHAALNREQLQQSTCLQSQRSSLWPLSVGSAPTRRDASPTCVTWITGSQRVDSANTGIGWMWPKKGGARPLRNDWEIFAGGGLEAEPLRSSYQTLPLPLSPLSDLKNRHGERRSASGCAPSIACWLDAPSRLGEVLSA